MKKKIMSALSSLAILALPLTAGAQQALPTITARSGSLDQGAVTSILGKVATFALGIIGGVAVIMILYAAFLFVTSQGGESTTKARKTLTWGIIGVVVAILSYALINFVSSFFAS